MAATKRYQNYDFFTCRDEALVSLHKYLRLHWESNSQRNMQLFELTKIKMAAFMLPELTLMNSDI